MLAAELSTVICRGLSNEAARLCWFAVWLFVRKPATYEFVGFAIQLNLTTLLADGHAELGGINRTFLGRARQIILDDASPPAGM
jgi:hypothetical protein